MKLIRFLPWWIVFVIGLLFALWHYRVALLSHIIEIVAQNHGIDDVQLDLEDIDFSQATFSEVNFRTETDQSQLEAKGENIRITYTLEELRKGNINRVTMDDLQVKINQSQTTDVITDTQFDELLLAASSLIGIPVPLEQLEIKHITVDHKNTPALNRRPAKLSASFENSQYSIKLSDEHSIASVKSNGQEIRATLSQNHSSIPSPFVQLDAILENSAITGTARFNIDSLNQWWESYGATAPLKNIQGSIEINLTTRQEGAFWDTQLSVISPSLTVNRTELVDIEMELQLQSPNLFNPDHSYTIQLLPGTRVSADNIQSNGIVGNNLQLELQGKIESLGKTIRFVFSPKSVATLESLLTPQAHAETITIQTNLHGEWSHLSGLQVTLNPEFEGTSSKLILSDVEAINLHLKSTAASKFSIDQDGEWKLEQGEWILNNTDFLLPGQSIAIQTQAVTIKSEFASSDTLKLGFDTQDLMGQHKENLENLLFLSFLKGNVYLDNHVITLDGSLLPGLVNSPLEFEGKYDFEVGKGSYEIFSLGEIDIQKTASNINKLIAKQDDRLKLHQGTAMASLIGKWEKPNLFHNQLEIEVSDIGGAYDELEFQGLNIQGVMTQPVNSKTDSVKIKLDNLQYGVMVNKLIGEIGLKEKSGSDIPSFVFHSFSGKIFDGRFQVAPFEYHPEDSPHFLTLSLTDLDITEILETQQFEGLEATGRLSGTLPVQLDDQGVRIANGHLANPEKQSGIVSYQVDPSQAEAISNALTDIVVKALEEFHYDLLTADVSYQPDGKLTVDFRIEGQSPNLDSNRPVHLNINTEQNVLSLLKSLQYANNLSSRLDEQLKSKFNN